MKPELEILAAYTFTIVAALIIASLIPPSVASSAPQAFAQPSSALLYVLYIAVVGVLLAAFFKFKPRIVITIISNKMNINFLLMVNLLKSFFTIM